MLCITEDTQQAQIMITDNGKGISPDDLPHIFERMYQCDSLSRSATGNGLGLSIAKRACQRPQKSNYSGQHSRSGTTFTILLPKGLLAKRQRLNRRLVNIGEKVVKRAGLEALFFASNER